MLDRYKLLKDIESLSDKLFLDFSGEKNIARKVWDIISKDPTFAYKVKSISCDWIIPSWQGRLNDLFEVKNQLSRYTVLSVDGSQIYPDRHQGTACHLINIGTVQLNYGKTGGMPGKSVFFNSEPHVFVDFDHTLKESPTELVNCARQGLELKACCHLVNSAENSTDPTVLLFDGSLIFWHLESKSTEVKQLFLNEYLDVLNKLCAQDILLAGYISLPKSKELLNLIRVYLCDFVIQGCQRYKEVNHLVDSQIARFYLKPYTRTTIFKNHSKITKYYPSNIHPHFFYMDIGQEIVRIEIPAWIASDRKKVDIVSQVIADQTVKGMGYPVALAEAHEQAVVKGPDREFFYQLINKASIERGRVSPMSQKVRKKMGMGI